MRVLEQPFHVHGDGGELRVGCVFHSVGSTSLVPLCLAPLLFLSMAGAGRRVNTGRLLPRLLVSTLELPRSVEDGGLESKNHILVPFPTPCPVLSTGTGLVSPLQTRTLEEFLVHPPGSPHRVLLASQRASYSLSAPL